MNDDLSILYDFIPERASLAVDTIISVAKGISILLDDIIMPFLFGATIYDAGVEGFFVDNPNDKIDGSVDPREIM